MTGVRRLHWADMVFAALLLGAVVARLAYYEPLGNSIAARDTESYIQSSRQPIPSAQFFSGVRPPTMNLLYAGLGPQAAYSLINVSSPGDFIQFPLTEQAGLERIPLAQTLLSIFSWSMLAWVVYCRLAVAPFKFLGAALVLAFAFTPQMAEWDYVLLSEPVSLSLFVLLLALSLELLATLAGPAEIHAWKAAFLALACFLVLVLWTFTRDSNAYFLLPLLLFVLALMVFGKGFRDRLPLRALVVSAVLLASLFFLHNVTMQRSGRWASPLFNNILVYIFPNPDHLAFFEQRGMPLTAEVLALQDGFLSDQRFFDIDYFMAWMNQRGTRSYMEFILLRPGWALKTFGGYMDAVFSENRQVFFIPNPEVSPDWLVDLGDLLHPRTATVFVAFGLQLLALAALSYRNRDAAGYWLTGLLALFFAGEMVMLFVSILGDSSNIIRHSLGSVMPLRLSMWLLPAFILDAFSRLTARQMLN